MAGRSGDLLKALDELEAARLRRDLNTALVIADAEWLRQGGDLEFGAAALAQLAFLTAFDRGDQQAAATWRARASIAAAQTGEVDIAALLLVPIAEQVAGRANDADAGICVLDEIAQAADWIDAQQRSPRRGVSPERLRRVAAEKAAWLLWRSGRFDEAVERYRTARDHAPYGSRDRLRVDAGLALAEACCVLTNGVIPGAAVDVLVGRLEPLRAEAQRNRWYVDGDRIAQNLSTIDEARRLSQPIGPEQLTSLEL